MIFINLIGVKIKNTKKDNPSLNSNLESCLKRYEVKCFFIFESIYFKRKLVTLLAI